VLRDAAVTVRQRLPPRTGRAFPLRRGQVLTVIDPLGEQVADLIAFADDDATEHLSSGRTLDYASTLRLTTGHVLYSDRSRAMLTIVEDTVGRHDLLYTPCAADTFRILYGDPGPRPSCEANLISALATLGVARRSMPTTFNIFMHVEISGDGTLHVLPPLSRAGDHIALCAEMDLIVGVTACSADLSNNHRFKPIDVEVSA
jgi:uncharacterized protein YcgI (DUF1989 family)